VVEAWLHGTGRGTAQAAESDALKQRLATISVAAASVGEDGYGKPSSVPGQAAKAST